MSKMRSRKFIAFIIWTILVAVSIIVTKTIQVEVVSWYGAVTMIYIGSNAVQKFALRRSSEDSN